jgi:hypothetical protein
VWGVGFFSSGFWEDGETVVQKPLKQMKQEFDSLRYYHQYILQRERCKTTYFKQNHLSWKQIRDGVNGGGLRDLFLSCL